MDPVTAQCSPCAHRTPCEAVPWNTESLLALLF